MALGAVQALVSSGGARLIGEVGPHLALPTGLVERRGITGPRIHDARIAAIRLGHSVDEVWTADRDVSDFPAPRTRNPLVARA